ncbi:hypothetical protein [Nocardioides sp. SYSU DS0663]|uniref:hypothetical protein n=1 Tax=Nocardioides sp. SYSU DS0663 TaxID=3416445 RepID=UPI003F4C117D
MSPLPWGALRQPDRFSCGASVLVVARMLREEQYAAATAPRFDAEVLATHRRVTRPWLRRRPQLPWPRFLGTPPWAVARELTALTGQRHRVRPASRSRVASAPMPYALFVGDRLLPRHVLLVLGTDGGLLSLYDPTTGGVRAGHGRWARPWFVVSAAGPRPAPPARRTRA